MREIGGYFEIELKHYDFIYDKLITLNSARNCLVYLIKSKRITRLHLPYYNCAVIEDAVRRFCPETLIHFYHVDENFVPILEDFPAGEYLYYVNYYGLQDSVIRRLLHHRLIVDNAQAFYSPFIPGVDTIYCPRKFFGVADGGILHTSARLIEPLEEDTSWEHCVHLLKRIDGSAALAFADYQVAERSLLRRPLKQMSKLTKRMLSSIDYVTAREKRATNFKQLHRFLAENNELSLFIELAQATDTFVPFCYPFKTRNAEAIRSELIENKIYVPTYWPELFNSTDLNSDERAFVKDIVCLPIDQRYGVSEMMRIIDYMKDLL